MRVTVVGAGAAGVHCARALLRPVAADQADRADPVEVVLVDRRLSIAQSVAQQLGRELANRPSSVGGAGEGDVGDGDGGVVHQIRAASSMQAAGVSDVVVLCVPNGSGVELARKALADTRGGRGPDVVSIADSIADVQQLIGLDQVALDRGRRIVVGAGCSPGLSCLLAAHAAGLFERVEEIHVAKSGTGGPACARQHHRALRQAHWEWRNGAWIRRRASSGRQLVWFPERVGGLDSYRAALSEPFLLHRTFPGASRLTARIGATRRDRLTGWLPMMRPPHADGGPGGLRVEVWGHRQGVLDVVVYGLADHPARVAGIVAAAAGKGLQGDRFASGGVLTMADCRDPGVLLRDLHTMGVRVSVFEGAP